MISNIGHKTKGFHFLSFNLCHFTCIWLTFLFIFAYQNYANANSAIPQPKPSIFDLTGERFFIPTAKKSDLLLMGFSLEDYANFKFLSKFDLIVQSVTMSELSKSQEAGLLKAINSGIGIAGAHGGIADSFRKQTNYQFMIGGQWVEHPGKITKFTVNFLEDELTQGLEDFEIETEQYYMHYDPSIEIIATSKFNGNPFSPNNTDFILDPTWIDDIVMPVAWKKRYGLGRVFNMSIGHDPDEFMKHPDAWVLLTRGFIWAMR